jgi:predicted nucleic acid-binding protein
MIVIADTSPLNYLILIDKINLLHILYEEITIPEAVFTELQATKTPEKVKGWITHRPKWLCIQKITSVLDKQLCELHLGEAEAIALAEELNAAGIIIDEKEGRKIAIERGLTVTGLLGVLRDASSRNLINLEATLNDLEKTAFRVSPILVRELIEQERKRQVNMK